MPLSGMSVHDSCNKMAHTDFSETRKMCHITHRNFMQFAPKCHRLWFSSNSIYGIAQTKSYNLLRHTHMVCTLAMPLSGMSVHVSCNKTAPTDFPETRKMCHISHRNSMQLNGTSRRDRNCEIASQVRRKPESTIAWAFEERKPKNYEVTRKSRWAVL